MTLAALSIFPVPAQEGAGPGAAAEAAEQSGKPTKRWTNSTELSFVALSGNSSASTVGLRNTYKWTNDISTFTAKVSGLRTESENKDDRFALGSASDFRVVDGEKNVTAENYKIVGRYDYKLGEHLFWYADTSWERDRFKGIDDRYVGAVGLGNLWVDSDRATFRTEYAATFTDETEVVDDPQSDDSFAGARVSSELVIRFGENSTYTNEFAFDGNVEESSDWRATMLNALSVSINDLLKLKAGLEWRFDNEPALEELDLFISPGVPDPVTPTVLAELDELDTIFTTALVIDF